MMPTEAMPRHEAPIPHAARTCLRYWLALAFVGALLVLCGAFLFVGGKAEAQEPAPTPEPANDGTQHEGGAAEPSDRSGKSHGTSAAPPSQQTPEWIPKQPPKQPPMKLPETTPEPTTEEPPEATPEPTTEEPTEEPPEATHEPEPAPVEGSSPGSAPTPGSETTPQSRHEPVPQPVSEPITGPSTDQAPGPSAGTANSPPPVAETARTVPVREEPGTSEANSPESAPTGSDPEGAVPQQVSEPAAEPAQAALTSKLSHELSPGESSEHPIPVAASETAIPQSSPPDDVVERLASEFARAVDKLLDSFTDPIATLGGRASHLVAGLTRAVSGAVGWLLEGEGPSPVDDPLIPPATPAAPPPPVPIPVGQSYLAGGSFSGESVFSGGKSEKLMQQFAVLDVLSLPLLQGSERTWTSREPLRPNSAPRPPNDRPG
jgi:hypothetical protein